MNRLQGKTRDDFVEALGRVLPSEVMEFRRRLGAGLVNGNTFVSSDGCGCFIGTVAMCRGATYQDSLGLLGDRPTILNVVADEIRGWQNDNIYATQTVWEKVLYFVYPGYTPENNETAADFADAVDEFIMSNPEAFAEVQL